MKIHSLLFIISLMAIISCKSKVENENVPSMIGVKKMTVTEVEASHRFGKASLGDTLSVKVFTYDENGKVQKEYLYDEGGLDVEKTYTYKDTIVSVWSYHEKGILSYSRTDEYTYNSKGKLLKSVSYFRDEIDGEEIFVYDTNDNVIYHKETSADKGSFSNYEETTEYEYDEFERILTSVTSKTHFYSKSEPSVVRKTYQYNDDGTIVIISSDDYYKSRSVYDKFNNVIENNFVVKERDIMDGANYVYEHEYDKNNRVVKITSYYDEVVDGYEFYEYEYYE